jgi:hypothetical protein
MKAPVLLLVTASAIAPAPAAGEAAVKRTVRANLDGDARKEGVQKVTTTRPNPFGGTAPLPVEYVRVVDRRRGRLIKRRVSPRGVERARFRVRDGPPEVWFNGVQGMGFFHTGLYAWTGAGRRVLWYWNSARSVAGRRSAGARAELEDRDPFYPGARDRVDRGGSQPG